MYFLPYLCVCVVLFFLSLPLGLKPLNSKSSYLCNDFFNEFLIFFTLLFFLGLRGFIFSDVFIYYPFYENVPSFFSGNINFGHYLESNGWERGYLLYTFICKSLFSNYFVFQFVSTFIDFLLFRKAVNDYLPRNVRKFAYLFFYVFYGMIIEINLLRNVKAILIFLLAIRYIGVNFKKYFCFIVIACFFHRFSIIYLPLYFLLSKKWNRKIILFIWIIGNIFFLLQIPLFTKLILLVANTFLNNSYSSVINYYFSSDLYSQSYGLGFGWIERQISFIIAFHYSKKLYHKDNRNYIFFNLFYIYSFIFLFFSDVSIVVEREPYLFASGYWFLFPLIYSFLTKKEKSLFFTYFFLISILKVAAGNNNILVSYKFCFFDNYEQRLSLFNKNIKLLLGD